MSSLWVVVAVSTIVIANIEVAAAPAVHFGADSRSFDVRTCTTKGMDAMQAQNFIKGTKAPNSAWGFNRPS
jgi:hypothetical protein